MNVELNRSEAFWSPTNREPVVLADEGVQIEAYAYTLVNPVKDGLVMYGNQWPGVRSSPHDMGNASTLTLTALRHLLHHEVVDLREKTVTDEEASECE